MFKIEKKVPPPPTALRRTYPFSQMNVGESFVVPIELHNSVTTAACQHGRRNGVKFTIRKCDEGYRCWRIE